MTNLPSTPLQRLLAKAAQTERSTGESARFKARHATGGAGQVILLDVSGSMADRVLGGTKHQLLKQALHHIYEPHHKLIAFSHQAVELTAVDSLPSPAGGTALELGLAVAARHQPAATLVISDGEPNNPEAALQMAERLSGVIDVIYCGDEANTTAIDFMRRLARVGCGRYATHSWSAGPALAHTMRLMIAGPTSA